LEPEPSPLNVSIRVTATGDESAALRALPSYQSIGFVAGTGKPIWWIVGAQRWRPVNYNNSAQPASSSVRQLAAATVSPDGCHGAPVATSDGQRVLCSGTATYPVNEARLGVSLFGGL